jgi:imidazolonepropionase-like amidohydrolase
MDDKARARYDANLSKAFDPNDRDIANKYAKEWATHDTEKAKKVAEAGSEAIRKMEQMERETRPTAPPAKRMDLRNMTDQELRDRINRENLERQYNQYFNQQPPAKISKGRQIVQTALAVGGTIMATASTALGIALAIKQLKES